MVGIIGTLLGVLITQWLTSRREDKKWARERTQERIRWQRERKRELEGWQRERVDRQAQWEREDATRRRQELLDLYSGIFVNAEKWSEAVLPERLALITKSYYPPEEQLQTAFHAAHAVELTATTLHLITPIHIDQTVTRLCITMSRFHMDHLRGGPKSSNDSSEASGYSLRNLRDFYRILNKLRDQIRRDLGTEEHERAWNPKPPKPRAILTEPVSDGFDHPGSTSQS